MVEVLSLFGVVTHSTLSGVLVSFFQLDDELPLILSSFTLTSMASMTSFYLLEKNIISYFFLSQLKAELPHAF